MDISSLHGSSSRGAMEISRTEMKLQARRKKLEEANELVHSMVSGNVLFAGVSGSVSYLPEPDDDIDIFLIVKTNKLWKELLKSFVVRRLRGNSDICLCLAFDDKYALHYYRQEISGLAVKDSVNVVSIFGGEYYSRILHSSPAVIAHYKPSKKSNSEDLADAKEKNSWASSFINSIFFIIGSSWLYLKQLYVNKMLEKQGRTSERFRTVAGPHRFYLETEKYRELDRKYREGPE